MKTGINSSPSWISAVEDMSNRGFIFVHINKTGGSSIREALAISNYQHVRASDIVTAIGKRKWAELTTFATIRNPWDRLVSMYHWRVKTNQTRLADKHLTFQDWLDLCLRKQNAYYVKNPLMLASQSYWLCDQSGTILVDRLLRFERFVSEFSELCLSLGLEPIELPHLKKTRRKHYSCYFNNDDADLVREIYADDIETFGYCFGREPA